MSRVTLQPKSIHHHPELRRPAMEEFVCRYCFETVKVGRPGKNGESTGLHMCAERILVRKPAAPPPFN
jgi:hypothetical protein